VQFGGEVASVSNWQTATGPMVSGVPPFENLADSFGEVAFQRQVQVQPSDNEWLDDCG
jgi:hypothetical protein